jgi:hypothetical protein
MDRAAVVSAVILPKVSKPPGGWGTLGQARLEEIIGDERPAEKKPVQ